MKPNSFWARLMVILTVFALVLAACAPATETPAPVETEAPVIETEAPVAATEEPVAATEEPVVVDDPYAAVDPSGQTVIFWHQHTRARETALIEIVDEFNATNEWGITVVAEYQGGYGDIFNKMLTFMNTPDVPTLVVAYQNQAATYQLADALIDINLLVNSPTWGLSAEEQADFFPGFFTQDVFPNFGNQRLGFPPNRSMEVVYYNLTWLQEMGFDGPPTTPEEFKEMACMASTTPFSAATAEGSMGYELSVDASRFASWTFAFGGDIFDYTTGQYSLNNEATVAAMSFLQDLFTNGCASYPTESYGDQTDFGAGKLLFTVGSTSGLPFYRDAVEAGANFEWGVAALPHTTPDPVMNIYGASVSIPRTTAEQELASWLFVKYYTSTDVQAKWSMVSEYFPVRASVAAVMTDYFAENPAFKTAFDMLQYGKFEPPVPGYDFVRDMMEEAMAAIVDGADAATTLAALEPNANASLAEQMAIMPESPDPWAKVDPTGQTITFWHNHTGGRDEFLMALAEEFNATNEWGITVIPEYQGNYPDIFNKMLGLLNTPDVPDLVVAYQNQAATYQVADALLDMDSLVNSIKWGLSASEQADFFPGFFAQDIFPNFGNARLGFPPNRSMEVVYYNMTWLNELGYDAPPTTPEQFKEIACKAATTPFSGSTAPGTSKGYEMKISDASTFAAWTFAFGGDIYDAETGQFTYNSEAAVAAMNFVQDLFNSGCATYPTENFGEQTDFGAGIALFTTGSSSGLPYYAEAVTEGANFEWSVAAFPYTGETPAMNIYGASVSMPKTTPERELATWLFLKYYTSAEVQAEWAMVSGYFPVRASVAEGLADFFAENPAYQTAFDMLQYGKFEPPVPGYDFVRSKVAEAVAAIVDSDADVQTTLDALNEEANAILAEQMTFIPTPVPPTATP